MGVLKLHTCRRQQLFFSSRHLLRLTGDTSAERVSVSTSSPLEAGNVAGMRKALAEIEVMDVFKVFTVVERFRLKRSFLALCISLPKRIFPFVWVEVADENVAHFLAVRQTQKCDHKVPRRPTERQRRQLRRRASTDASPARDSKPRCELNFLTRQIDHPLSLKQRAKS